MLDSDSVADPKFSAESPLSLSLLVLPPLLTAILAVHLDHRAWIYCVSL